MNWGLLEFKFQVQHYSDLDAIINNAKMPRLPIDDFTAFER